MKNFICNIFEIIIQIFNKVKSSFIKEHQKILYLSPKIIKSKHIKQYTKRIHAAIVNDDISNIAITGNYGTGKSSIIKTFIDDYQISNNQFVKINIANYFDKIKLDNFSLLDSSKSSIMSNDVSSMPEGSGTPNNILDAVESSTSDNILDSNDIKI